MRLLAPELDDVYGAVWLAAAAMTFEALHDAEGPVAEEKASLRQVDIRRAAQKICSQKVHSARVSQWTNADHEDNSYNYLREVGSRRRLTVPGECDGHRERPDLPVDDTAPVLELAGPGGTVTCGELKRWVSDTYPELVASRPVGTGPSDAEPSSGAAEADRSPPQPAGFSPDRPAAEEPVPARAPAPRLARLYRLLALLPRHDADTSAARLPENGVYLFFERGEQMRVDRWTVDRVVRVGTHRADGNFRGRIRQHYGNRSDLGGHKNSSIFRKHVGGALLRAANPRDARLDAWLGDGRGHEEVESAVSRRLRGRFTFACFRVPRQEDRLGFERGLVGLLARKSAGGASSSWLGRKAANPKIPDSGLWNTQHTRSTPLSEDRFERLEERVRASAPTVGSPSSSDGRLVVIPCGKQKTWDDDPSAGPAAAEHAYTSWYADLNREYAETFGDAWLVLSAKYGFLTPRSRIPGPYDVTFKRSATGPVPTDVVQAQAGALGLERFDEALLLGGQEYRDVARRALEGRGVEVAAPFSGVSLFDARSALETAVEEDEPFPV